MITYNYYNIYKVYFNDSGEDVLNTFINNQNPVFSKLCSSKLIVIPITTNIISLIVCIDFSECGKMVDDHPKRSADIFVIDMSREMSNPDAYKEIFDSIIDTLVKGMNRLFMTLSSRRNFFTGVIDVMRITLLGDDVDEDSADEVHAYDKYFYPIDKDNDKLKITTQHFTDQFCLLYGVNILLGLLLPKSLNSETWRNELREEIFKFLYNETLIEAMDKLIPSLCLYGQKLSTLTSIAVWEPAVQQVESPSISATTSKKRTATEEGNKSKKDKKKKTI